MSVGLPPAALKLIKRGKFVAAKRDEAQEDIDLLNTCIFWGLMGYEL